MEQKERAGKRADRKAMDLGSRNKRRILTHTTFKIQ